MKVLLENLLRFEDGVTVTVDDIQALADWQKDRRSNREMQYRPARVLLQDFTGVPCVVDLAAMRDRSEEHTSELVTNAHLVCRLLLEKKQHNTTQYTHWTCTCIGSSQIVVSHHANSLQHPPI